MLDAVQLRQPLLRDGGSGAGAGGVVDRRRVVVPHRRGVGSDAGAGRCSSQHLLELLNCRLDLPGEVRDGLREFFTLGARAVLARREVADEHVVDFVKLQLLEVGVEQDELVLARG